MVSTAASTSPDELNRPRLWSIALILAIITVVYNIVEGAVSLYFGLDDEAISLLGFGVDSLVEVVSGLGILHMVWRLRLGAQERRDEFERTALRITGWGFYVLAGGIVAGGAFSLITGRAPTTTLPGVIISIISIITMRVLIKYKKDIGKKLNSEAIIADARCTETCYQLSIVLLVASFAYELLHLAYIDTIGGLVIAWFAWQEGSESLTKAKSNQIGCGCSDHCHNG